MAFKGLKRFFSIGSKRNKNTKKHAARAVLHPLPPISETGLLPDDSGEVAANQLLRSSSARYAAVKEFEYSSLPPLPHPINHVLQTPATSTASLASASSSINSSTRGTYTVKVHRRRRHASTEFPNANPGLDDEPTQRNNDSQFLGLRSDPSVASLLDLYDEHGRLPARAFSNSPPKDGRTQVARNGSTLRQLLGNPSSSVNSRSDSSVLGDISWAEQFLGETESLASSASSPGLPTPQSDSHFPQLPLQANPDSSFITEQDFSLSMLDNPAISSLEVELSDIAETPPREVVHHNPYSITDPKTPQRASQVFGFLSSKRRSRIIGDDDERSLPELPSTFSPPSSAEDSPLARGRSRSHFSSDSSADSIDSTAPLPETPIETHFSSVDVHPNTSSKPANDVQVIMAHGPTKVIVTAPTPSHHDNVAPTRGPRGPRAHHRQRSGRHLPSRDAYTALPSRRHVSRGSVSSLGSISLSYTDQRTQAPAPATAGATDKGRRDKGKRRSILAMFEKENDHLSAQQELPRTPIRTDSISRPIPHRGVTRASGGAPPSPASSLELSVAAQKLMGDLRIQRMKAREQDRRGRVYI
ncbi:hypothetical protein GGX14DRAFT_424935 [Mycena pura]|uniref:Uncharacterized protein n=1 Tax=Mycena pura TaxID=153505 RepID=A0AAD6YN15_9AGAR|nr:hypothetical protein GGX14DRAFT_424935 [Mycena pura]